MTGENIVSKLGINGYGSVFNHHASSSRDDWNIPASAKNCNNNRDKYVITKQGSKKIKKNREDCNILYTNKVYLATKLKKNSNRESIVKNPRLA